MGSKSVKMSNKSSAVAEMGDRLGTIDMSRKVGAAVLLSVGGEGARSLSNTIVAWAKAYLHTKWQLDSSSRLATIDMSRKVGAAVPLSVGSWVPI